MFRIRKVSDDIYPMNQRAVKQVLEIMRLRFPAISEEKVLTIPEHLRNPLKYKFRSILFVAENFNGKVRGFALLLHAPDLDFCYLDFIATNKDQISAGVGGALYERCREEALSLKSLGIFMECLPDDPLLCHGKDNVVQNAIRLNFYERYGARPISNTLYETPVKPGDSCAPYLVFDNLDRETLPTSKRVKTIVDAILRRKYGDYCPEDYIVKVVDSFRDDPVILREFRYLKIENNGAVNKINHKVSARIQLFTTKANKNRKPLKPVYVTVNSEHSIHHVKEVGYVESPVRIANILKSLGNSGMFEILTTEVFPEKYIRQVHSADMVDFLKSAETNFPSGNSVYPYIFPIRNAGKRPKDVNVLAGYFCIDTFTPIHQNVWKAASGAVNCALTCANKIIETGGLAYALVRPPGHHAESKVFGGFCYLNTAAITANYLSQLGRVAILDIDYHHGNGQQEIFYKRNDVLTLSIHGLPATTYPYFCGFKNEKGEGDGLGFNINYPLDEKTNASDYRITLAHALRQIELFRPGYLIVCFGLDTAKDDPTGTFTFRGKDFERNGRMIGSLKKPVLVIQEGGYLNRTLGANTVHFFKGLVESFTK
jgi:acetoin utilization deacetylase AcuC-like enzyme